MGPSEHLLVGCSDDAIAAGFKAKTIIMDAANGTILRTTGLVGGSTTLPTIQATSGSISGARDMTEDGTKSTKRTPVLGIVDAVTMEFIENVRAAPNCKSVVADPVTNRVLMPLTASASGPGRGVFSRLARNQPKWMIPSLVHKLRARSRYCLNNSCGSCQTSASSDLQPTEAGCNSMSCPDREKTQQDRAKCIGRGVKPLTVIHQVERLQTE